jgi:Fic family protein
MVPEEIDSTKPEQSDGRWPLHRYETRPWTQQHRSGTREDRILREVVVALPPVIADREVPLDNVLVTELERALREIVALDLSYGHDLRPLAALLLRTESVASSKIEYIHASTDDYARAGHGIRANPSALAMVAATEALNAMIEAVSTAGSIDLATILTAHRVLLADDAGESDFAGRLRNMQNWIGGSDHSPRGAQYVPPPPETVEPYMDDLLTFANRDDIPVLAQAAVVHAQFESIHPFTDGNGRIGRALVNAILRRRGVTTQVVVPVASALVAHRDRYFDLLRAYCDGDHRPIVSAFATASRIAAAESRSTAENLAALPLGWAENLGRVRSDSTVARLLEILPTTPAFSASDLADAIGAPESSAYAAIDRLAEAEIIRPLTDRKRNQIWGATQILDELDDLNLRIEHATRMA